MSEFQLFLKQYVFNYDYQISFNKNIELLNKHNNYDIDSIENYNKFTSLFWRDKNPRVLDIKKRCNIANNISYAFLIKSHKNDKYIELLKDYWLHFLSTEKLSEKYHIKESYIENIILDIYINKDFFRESESEYGSICNKCLGEEFIIRKEYNNNDRAQGYYIQCTQCDEKFSNNQELLNSKEAENLLEQKKQQHKDFEEFVIATKQSIEDKYCPNCQTKELDVWILSIQETNYKIGCNNCRKSWETINSFDEEHSKFQQRAAMMISIKNKEQEMVEERIQNKNNDELLFKKDDLIKSDEMDVMISNAIRGQADISLYWSRLFKNIKSCNRSEISMLKAVLEEFKSGENVKDSEWYFTDRKNEKVTLYQKIYDNDKPVIIELFRKTGMLNTRGIIRKLMQKNLLACSEEENLLFIHPILLTKEKNILSISKPQNIENEIKYLIYKNHNYTCYNCGSDDKPLKIGYLSANKDMNNISSMIPICKLCYDDVTENEVLVDGTLAVLDMDKKENEFVSWQFLTTYLPGMKEVEDAYEVNEEFIIDFGETNLIKAYAITLYNLVKKGDGIKSERGFFSYVSTILNNEPGTINVKREVANEYDVDFWIDEI